MTLLSFVIVVVVVVICAIEQESKISHFLLQYEAEDAASILRHWGSSFVEHVVKFCDADWRAEALQSLEQVWVVPA